MLKNPAIITVSPGKPTASTRTQIYYQGSVKRTKNSKSLIKLMIRSPKVLLTLSEIEPKNHANYSKKPANTLYKQIFKRRTKILL